MADKITIKEIFESIQGEGPYVGEKQLFVRTTRCNLNCKYCDTPHLPVNINDTDTFFEFTPNELVSYINEKFDIQTISFISLTGGEPLIWNEFLAEFLPKVKTKFYSTSTTHTK